MSRRPTSSKSDVEQEAGFLGRWSRRKLEARHNDSVEVDKTTSAEAERDADTSNDAAKNEHTLPDLTDADMPDIESITGESNVAEFLSPGVTEALRNKALRKLFHSAAFNVRDGLDDYDEDYTNFEKLGDIVTADMRHQMEMAAERLRERALAALDSLDDTQDEHVDDVSETNAMVDADRATDESGPVTKPDNNDHDDSAPEKA